LRKVVDDLDKAILKELQNNARTPFAKIAAKLGADESTIRFRVKRLIRRGVIRRFTALLDPRKMGFSVTAVLMIKVNPKFFREASTELGTFHEIHHLYQRTGEYDLVAMVHTVDHRKLNELIKRVKAVKGVRDASVSIVTELLKMDTRLKV
jgi:Lrp/AsnC family transcriptional regulator for asnA, asnC and gidA